MTAALSGDDRRCNGELQPVQEAGEVVSIAQSLLGIGYTHCQFGELEP